ncbi:MAG: hypothetical protein GY795_20460 [Desulfobacterales bacterium]|nr:hypothetical protein [Desulfobacterales bacterium]
MTKKVKKVFIGIGIFFGLIIFLFVTTLFYLETNHAQQFIQGKINKAIPGTVSWEELSFSLVKGKIELKNVLLKDPADNKLAGFDRLFLDLSLSTLLKSDLTVETLILEKPWAMLKTDSKGKLNLMSAFPAPKPEKKPKKEKPKELPVNIVVRELTIAKGSVSFEKPDNLKAVASEINLSANADLSDQQGNLVLEIGNGKIESQKINTSLDQFQIKATLKEGRVEPLVCQIGSAPLKLELSGKADNIFKEPFLDLNLDLGASLSDLREILQIEPVLTGGVSAKLKVKGAVNNPEVSFHLDYGGGNLAGNRVDQIDLDFQLKDRLLDIDSLNANAASGNLNLHGQVNLREAFAKGFLSPQRELNAISYKLILEQNNIELEKLLCKTETECPPEKSKLKGVVNSDIIIDGTGIYPGKLSAMLSMELSAKQLAANQPSAPNDIKPYQTKLISCSECDEATGWYAAPIDLHLKTEAGMDKGIVTVKQLNAEAGSIKLEISGNYNLSSQEVSANILLNAPDLENTLSSLGIKDVSGKLRLKTDISGSVKQPVFDVVLNGKQLHFREITIGKVDLNAALDQSGTLNVSQLSLENQGSVLKGKGTLNIFEDGFKINHALPLNISINLSNIETKDFINKKIVSGTIDGQINVRGNMNAPDAELSLQGKKLALEAARLGDVNIDARLSQGMLHLDKLNIKNRKSVLRASGTAHILEKNKLKVLKNPAIDVDLESKTAFIEDFTDKLKGKLVFSAHAKGNVMHPKGTVNLRGTGLDLGVQKIKEFRLISEFDGKKIGFKPLQIFLTSKESVEAEGWVSLPDSKAGTQPCQKTVKGDCDKDSKPGKPEMDIVLTSKGINLRNIDIIRKEKIADGKIMLNLSGKGSVGNPEVKGEISLEKLRVKGKTIDDIGINLDLRDQLAKVSGKLNFDFSGFYHLAAKDFSATAVFDKTDLWPYFKMAGRTDLTGALSGKIEAKGNAGKIGETEASADLSDLALFLNKKELIKTENFKAFFKNNEVSIQDARLALLRHGHIDVKGNANIKGPLDLKVKGDIPLKVVSLFVEETHGLTGNLILSGTVGGDVSQPDIKADIRLKKIGMTVPNLMQQIHDVNGQILLSSDLADIKKIEGRLDTGRFGLSGKVNLKKFNPSKVDLKVSANALPLEIPETLDALLNTDLKVRGTPEKTTVSGEAVILEGRYYKDVNLTMNIIKGIGKKKRETAPVRPEIKAPFLKNMIFDVNVKHRNPFLVDNNLATLEINPDLSVHGKLNNILISGRAEIGSGTIAFQKKKFDVKKGAVDFLNPYKIEPTLNIESEVKVRKWTISLNVSGTPDNLDFKLTSDPSEEYQDILSLIAVGKTTSELAGSGEGEPSQTPAQMLAEIVAKTVGEDVKKATGLDVLEVETQGQGDDDSDRIKVTIGKELSRRMTVKYSVESKNGEMVQQASTEYKFLENLLLNGFQDNKGVFGGELKYRLEFR